MTNDWLFISCWWSTAGIKSRDSNPVTLTQILWLCDQSHSDLQSNEDKTSVRDWCVAATEAATAQRWLIRRMGIAINNQRGHLTRWGGAIKNMYPPTIKVIILVWNPFAMFFLWGCSIVLWTHPCLPFTPGGYHTHVSYDLLTNISNDDANNKPTNMRIETTTQQQSIIYQQQKSGLSRNQNHDWNSRDGSSRESWPPLSGGCPYQWVCPWCTS